MATWNDVFVERLFNNSIFENGTFRLPEGYGSSENYSRVIDLFRMLYNIDYRVVLEIDPSVKHLWRVKKEGVNICVSTGDSPEDAIARFLSFYESK